ncbi:MAG: helix-turn-helix domain-containing protein [Verrucomicrobia bacterium]|nr:helix-turn-helix domain-containing protein [Verrucomicrobiota bacterium]
MQTIGERLEEARKKKGISIREAAEATKIRGDYLQKFEGNQFDIGLTELYARGFLRNYANFLKLPTERIIADYAALGHGEVRPRQPSREIYGRLDISVASAAEASDRAAPPEEASAEPAAVRGIAQPRYPRGSSTLPTGPDPALVFKYLKLGGLIVVALIAVLVLKSLFSSGPASAPSRTPAPAATALKAGTGASYSIVALDTAFVRVTHRIGEDTDGEEIFKGTLTKGQSQVIPWTGPQNVWASAGENILIEYNGKRWPSLFTGYSHGHMENPPAPR